MRTAASRSCGVDNEYFVPLISTVGVPCIPAANAARAMTSFSYVLLLCDLLELVS